MAFSAEFLKSNPRRQRELDVTQLHATRLCAAFALCALGVAGCDRALAPPPPDLMCAEESVTPLAFQWYVRNGNGQIVDSARVANRVTEPHRTGDTVYVFGGSTAVMFYKTGGRCQTLFDSLLARSSPPIVRAIP
jgi:hypothetical protein